MRENSQHDSLTLQDEVTSGVGASTAAKPQHVKQQDQFTSPDHSDGRGGTSGASKPRLTKRRARKIDRYPALLPAPPRAALRKTERCFSQQIFVRPHHY
jgi:hypothetical protein